MPACQEAHWGEDDLLIFADYLEEAGVDAADLREWVPGGCLAGSGYDAGSGSGHGYGYSSGSGTGSGHGYGYGHGSGHGYGYGYGYGSG